jgi:hypothetical protein
MKRTLILLVLATCAPSPPVFKPVSVDVPIAIPCRMIPVAKPDFALSHVTTADDIAQKTKAALIELNQRRGYETELEAHVTACH